MKPRYIVIWSLILGTLFIISRFSFLLFHTLTEFFSIVVAGGIFMVAWNTRKFIRNDYFLFLGIAYLFVAIIDTLHTFMYDGMWTTGANIATQYWISARYMESISLFAAPFFARNKTRFSLVWAAYVAATCLIIGSIQLGFFPAAFDNGLTTFKIASEFVISGILLAAYYYLWTIRKRFQKNIFRLLSASIILTILAELAFTLYSDPYGLFNMVGHFLKLLSFGAIYHAVIVTNLTKPYSTMFRDLKNKEKNLEEANKAKIEFMNITVHELRNPLTSIIGYSKVLLQRGKLRKDEKMQVQVINEESWRLKRLVDDLLDIVKLEGGNMKFDMKTVDTNRLLEDSCREMESQKKGVVFRKKIDTPLPNVRADSGRILQVLRNLIGNAFKFTDKGYVELSAAEKDNGVLVCVRDTGIGIKEEDAGKLFNKFCQLDTKQKSKGTGLGLAISKEIITAHKGKIWVEPGNKGCTFSFWLPGLAKN